MWSGRYGPRGGQNDPPACVVPDRLCACMRLCQDLLTDCGIIILRIVFPYVTHAINGLGVQVRQGGRNCAS